MRNYLSLVALVFLSAPQVAYGAAEPSKVVQEKQIDSASWGDFLQWPEVQREGWILNFAKSYSNLDLGRLALASRAFHKLLQPLIKDRFFTHYWTSGEIKSDEVRHGPSHFGAIDSIAISPNGALVASGDYYNSLLELIDLGKNVSINIFMLRNHYIKALRFKDDGKLFVVNSASNSKSCELCEIDISSGKKTEFVVNTQFADLGAVEAAFSLNGQFLAIGSDGIIKLFDQNKNEIKVLVLPGCEFFSLSVSNDGTMIAVACHKSNKSVAIVWDVETGKPIKELTSDDSDTPACVAFSPCGKLLAIAWEGEIGKKDNIQLFDVQSWKKILQITIKLPPYALDFSPDGKRLVAGFWGQVSSMFYPVSQKNS